jgi:hypothetical protein
MYSRNYGRSESSAKIMPPPAYSGSAIRGGEPHAAENEEARTGGAFAPFSQNITLPKSEVEEEKRPSCETCEPPCEKFEPPPKKCEPPCEEKCPETQKKEKGILSSFLPDLSKEDLILIGIIIALAFDLADRDILLVALVAAAVIM